jgi:hypothetical protein
MPGAFHNAAAAALRSQAVKNLPHALNLDANFVDKDFARVSGEPRANRRSICQKECFASRAARAAKRCVTDSRRFPGASR